jgi:hypothetical protein
MSCLTFAYKNHRGVVATRQVRDAILMYDREPAYGYQPGWFIDAYCIDRYARRRFALANIQIHEAPLEDESATTLIARLHTLNPERTT